MSLRFQAPWLEFDLGQQMQVLSWAPHRPGFVTTRRILWREVRNADLGPELDVERWLAGQLEARDAADAVCFLTSRDLAAHDMSEACVEGLCATALATVGLSNAESVGSRLPPRHEGWGTINIALRLDRPLRSEALVELLSIVAQARTRAVLEAGLTLPTGPATGTGTDCIAVAAPAGQGRHVGLHTASAEAAGRAVLRAMRAGVSRWVQERGPVPAAQRQAEIHP